MANAPRLTKKLVYLIEREKNRSLINELSTEGQTLFSLLSLLVDIKYRIRYGESVESDQNKGYTKVIQSNLPDQLTPVDGELEDVCRRGLTDGAQ